MNSIPGALQPEIQELPPIHSRMTFLYVEHCKLSRDENAITIWVKDGVFHLPAAAITVLLLGPGTSISHRAVELIGDTGVSLVWVGEQGVRYYASGKPVTHSSQLLIRQAEMVSNTRKHLMVAKKMYQMRFPDEDVSALTMQQLRGREGSRIRQVYRKLAKKWNVEWNGREYNPQDYSAGNAVNQSLSAGHACLYGLSYAVIMALGCSPGLGFVHVGHERSFVYDLADLYKAEITIPVAFEIAASGVEDVGSATRKKVRDMMFSAHLAERMVKDIQYLLAENEEEERDPCINEVKLWNGTKDLVANGINYEERAEEGHDP